MPLCFALHIIVSSRRHLHSPPMYRPPKTNNSRTSRVNWPKWEAYDRNHNKSTAKCDIALPTDEGRQVQSAKTPKELCSTANSAAIVIRQINVDNVRCNIGRGNGCRARVIFRRLCQSVPVHCSGKFLLRAHSGLVGQWREGGHHGGVARVPGSRSRRADKERNERTNNP